METDFITIATCRFEPEAEAMRLLLRQEDIDVHVGDANAVMVNWFWGPMLGYIKVQVPRSQVAAAMEVLKQHPRVSRETDESDDAPATCLACSAPMPADSDRCPNCGWTYKLGDEVDEPGAEPGPYRYEYTVPYEPDVGVALEKLRQRVFESGDYNGAENASSTPEQAVGKVGEAGTRSILDITGVSDEPADGCVSPLASGELQAYFGTDRPAREAVKASAGFRNDLERGRARYVILYEGDTPVEILFAGCSVD